MTGGVSIEYALARSSARLGERPDERLWQQLRASRRVRVLLDAVRASPAAACVSGIEPLASPDAMELAFRQQFRLRVDEAVRWAPDEWAEAVRWTRLLVDLPALAHLATEPEVLPWMRIDPDLTSYALATLPDRHAALLQEPLAPLASALVEAEGERPRGATHLHRVVDAWERHWRALWPRVGADERANLDALVRLLVRHEQGFGSLAVEDADAARVDLAVRLSNLMRRANGQAAALFAWLALLALDLERLRGEFLSRAIQEAGVT